MRREIKLMMMIKMAELLKCFVKLVFNKEKKKKNSPEWTIRKGEEPAHIVDGR